MGQDHAKPKADVTTAEYQQEAAKMHHVTTKETIVAQKLPYEVEAERLNTVVKSLVLQPPLLTSSVEGAIIGKRDKLLEESTNGSAVLKEHQLFSEDMVRLFAQFQTIEMREGTAAAKRAEEIAARMGQTVYYSNVLRSNAAATAQRLKVTADSFADVDVIADEAQALHDRVVEVSHLCMEINGMITEADRDEIRAEVERRMNDELVRSRSHSQTSASSKPTTPRNQ